MTRREIDRVAEAVRRLQASEERAELTPARVSLEIGRAVLGAGASREQWAKWLAATGWPKDVVVGMAAEEAASR